MKHEHSVRVVIFALIALTACVPAEEVDTETPHASAPCPDRTEAGYDLRSPLAQAWLQRTLPPAPTTRVSVRLHLDPTAKVATLPFDVQSAERVASYSLTVGVFDFLGNTHPVTIWFVRVAADVWRWHALAPGADIMLAKPDRPHEGARGTLSFDASGALVAEHTEASGWSFWGSPPAARIAFEFGALAPTEAAENATALATPSEALSVDQDGYAVGSMRGFSIDASGEVLGYFSNGQRRTIGACVPPASP